jgi:hypothetical protein
MDGVYKTYQPIYETIMNMFKMTGIGTTYLRHYGNQGVLFKIHTLKKEALIGCYTGEKSALPCRTH